MANILALVPMNADNFDSGAGLEVNQTLTVRFEGAAGNPSGLDLTPRTIDAIARGLADKVRRGG